MKTHIIYLAAGNSRRFNSNKLLYLWQGKALYRHGLDELIKLVESSDDCQLIVVYQNQKDIYNYPKITNIVNPRSELGISYSIKAGLTAINETDKIFNIMFVVADQPYLKYTTITNMLDAFNNSNYTLASLKYHNQVGNPTIFKNKYFNELMALTGDTGGRKIINQHQEECLFYQVDDPLELYDIDKQTDLPDK